MPKLHGFFFVANAESVGAHGGKAAGQTVACRLYGSDDQNQCENSQCDDNHGDACTQAIAVDVFPGKRQYVGERHGQNCGAKIGIPLSANDGGYENQD